ncbi:hypothetical protein [Paractinoplanes lichenicola]|uniref:Uncharacterized protein n=1 Tax=Paractinoplanes lichenicola TaxID=2802976 RepID=A0ABS1VZS3_9ACTN|nr:hypothetical protein [Actinoplanes lichenicola]MBL7259933.1 hypothetical protein [Actinoplanes lichenicola]
MIDYYLIEGGGVIVEAFELAGDHTTVGLRSSLWRDGEWRGISGPQWRNDPELLAAVTPVDRDAAAAAYPGEWPDERQLPGEYVAIGGAPVLRLRDEPVPDGFRERRVYRVLFAGEPATDQFISGAGDEFVWHLHRVGGGVAWALDVTVLLTGADDAVGALLHELTADAKGLGLIPVIVERFA